MTETKMQSAASNYVIFETSEEGYDRFVLCLSSESLFTYMHDIENAFAKEKAVNTVLIDQLLITGDGENRFMSCKFVNGKFDFTTAKNIKPSEFFRQKTIEYLHENYYYTENSILTEEQKLIIHDED